MVPLGSILVPSDCLCIGWRKGSKGQKIADPAGTVSAAIHAPTSGTISAIEARPVAHSSGMDALCVEITTDGKDQWIEKSGISDFEHTSPAAFYPLSLKRELPEWAVLVSYCSKT